MFEALWKKLSQPHFIIFQGSQKLIKFEFQQWLQYMEKYLSKGVFV